MQDKLFEVFSKSHGAGSTSDSLFDATHHGIAEAEVEQRSASQVKLSKGGIPYGLVEAFCQEAEQGLQTQVTEVQVVRQMPL